MSPIERCLELPYNIIRLTTLEIKVFRKYTDKVSWLALNARQDLAVYVLSMSMVMNKAMIKDFNRIYHVVNKIKSLMK